MRQSMTIRLDQDVLTQAKFFASRENRTLTNYIETLIRKDINVNQQKINNLSIDIPLSVFLAEPIVERLITDPQEGDTPSDVVARQSYLDTITGWAK